MTEAPDAAPLSGSTEWSALHTLLAECFKEPTDGFVQEVRAGRLESELREHDAALGLGLEEMAPPLPADRGSLQRSYLALFEAMEEPFAPPVESPYKPWYGDREGGLLDGPSATEMERRYEAIDASPPPAYPPDHLALLLEYGALLLDAGADDQYREFVAEHLDWIEALSVLVDRAVADAPFYRWAVGILEAVTGRIRERLSLDDPSPSRVDTMVDRVEGAGVPDRDDGVFDP
ncbi:MAG: TorD/DmsD family molecular chaperone [Halodesulfurarchaeum sp.]